MVHAEPSHAPERRIGRVLKSQSLGRRRVMLIVMRLPQVKRKIRI
jgi:hypothetical protein